MSGMPSRATISLKDPSKDRLAPNVRAAILLHQIVHMWFDGRQQDAAKAFQVASQTLNGYMTGGFAVSQPMLKRMAKMLRRAEELERKRELRERRGEIERKSIIPLMRAEMQKLLDGAGIGSIGASGDDVGSGDGGDGSGVKATTMLERRRHLRAQVNRAKENGPPERAA